MEFIPFIDLCIQGKASPDEIDDYVEKWHNGDGGVDISLNEYLGMSWEEYGLWMIDAGSIMCIIDNHMQKKG